MDLSYDKLAGNGLVDANTFSFDQATLENSLKNIYRTYERTRPSTWPLVTLVNINKHCSGQYDGRQILPRYLAYDSQVMEVLLKKHTKKGLTQNGAAGMLHRRYPCNFTARDVRKGYIGMAKEEERAFTHDMVARQKAHAKNGKQHERGESASSTTTFAMCPSPTSSLCQTPACVQERDEEVRLKGALYDREQDLKVVKQEIREVVESKASEVERLQRKLDETRRDAQKYRVIQLDWTVSGMRKMIKERDGRIRELEKMCEDLRMENRRLKGVSMADKRARVEDYFSEDEDERPEKRTKSG